MLKYSEIEGFDWDDSNTSKNWLKHKVMPRECEEVFFDPESRILDDSLHSEKERRHIILGKTYDQRILFIVFTVRKGLIRVISARDIKKPKELKLYEKRA